MAIYQDLYLEKIEVSLVNIPINSNILTAPTSVDIATNIVFLQNTVGIIATLLNPTITTVHKVIILENSPISTTLITINQISGSTFNLGIGKTTQLLWNGVGWVKFISEALNNTDDNLRNRLTHTGVQEISTIAGLEASLNNKLANIGGTLIGTSGDGVIGFPLQLYNPISPLSGFKLFANSSGFFSWMGTDGFMRTLSSAITSDITYTLPNANGTIALLSDITSSATSSWGAITGTLSNQTDLNLDLNSRGLLNTTEQSWIGANNFSNIKISPTSGNFLEVFGESKIRLNRSGNYIWDIGTNFSGLLSNFSIYDASSSVHRFMITKTNGNVLINTIIDSGHKFQVNGTSRFLGDISCSGAIITSLDIGGRQVSAGDTYFNVSGNGFHYIRGQTRFTDATSGIVIGGTTKASSALVDIQSTTLGFLIPRMTTVQRNAIVATNGLQVYDTNLNKIVIHDGTSWGTVGAISGSYSATASATTTFTVTIGSTMHNINYKINVTPTAMLAAASFFVTNKTTTTFDVSYLTALTGAISFDYSIFR